MAPEPAGRKARLLLGSVALLAMSGLGLGSLSSAALYADTKSTTPATVTSGTVTLALGGSASTGGMAVASLLPSEATYTKVSAQNSGTAPARVSSTANWAAANALTADLQISLVTVADANATCDSTVSFTSPLNSATTAKTVSNVALTSNVATITTSAAHGLLVGQAVTISALTAGTAINGSYLVTATPTTTTFTVDKTNANITSAASTGTVTIPTVSTSGTSMGLFGSSTQGQQTGDRAFVAGATEYYCVRMFLPLASTAGGLTGTLTLTFNSEQSTNNA